MTAEADAILARAESMGVNTVLSGPMRIGIAQVMATEALARAAFDNVAADRKVMEETCATVLAVATPPPAQTPTSLFGRLMALLSPPPVPPAPVPPPPPPTPPTPVPSPPPVEPEPTGHARLDPAKTSPGLTLMNGGLTVVGSDRGGNAASIAPMPAQSWFEVAIDEVSGGIWMGVCNASHYFGSGGAAWAGGDPHVTAICINSGGCWIAGMGYAMHVDTPHMATAAGARWMIERDASKGRDSFGNLAPNGVIRARRGDFVTQDYAAPPGPLFAIVGLDPGPSQVTLTFGATPPSNSIAHGYVGLFA